MVVKSTYSQWGGQGKWSSHGQQGGESKCATCSEWVDRESGQPNASVLDRVCGQSPANSAQNK